MTGRLLSWDLMGGTRQPSENGKCWMNSRTIGNGWGLDVQLSFTGYVHREPSILAFLGGTRCLPSPQSHARGLCAPCLALLDLGASVLWLPAFLFPAASPTCVLLHVITVILRNDPLRASGLRGWGGAISWLAEPSAAWTGLDRPGSFRLRTAISRGEPLGAAKSIELGKKK